MSDVMNQIEILGSTTDYMEAYRRGTRVGRSECVRELAEWMIGHSYSTGDGDNLKDLLGELSWQINERIMKEKTP